MSSTAQRLFAFALVGVMVGAAVIAAWSDAASADAVWLQIVARFEGAFAEGAWRWLARATAITTGLAVALTLLELVSSVRREAREPEFRDAGATNVRDAVTEVRRRLLALTEGSKPNVVATFNELLRGAVGVSASDVHLSPTAAGLKLTYRVQGVLHDVAMLDANLAALLATRVKVLARLDTYVRTSPQDGRLAVSLDGKSIEARVSTLPTEGGERVVLRLVRGSLAIPELDALGFSETTVTRLREVLARPQGLFFVTGPVGCGKTTTLYAALQHIAKSRGSTTSLVTLEDPVELELPFATQTQMHARSGMTFAGALRSVLRQDPNVLMIGEIRDKETAEIATQAGLTGHLILTTVHGEGAAGPFARLMDMGIEPFAIASATLGAMSQRLVRTLCTACRRQAAPDPIVEERFGKLGIVLPQGAFYDAVGCDFCEGEGFAGQAPISEVLIVEGAVRAAVNAQKTTEEIQSLAVAEGMVPLVREGMMLAQRGETTLAEVLRVAG